MLRLYQAHLDRQYQLEWDKSIDNLVGEDSVDCNAKLKKKKRKPKKKTKKPKTQDGGIVPDEAELLEQAL